MRYLFLGLTLAGAVLLVLVLLEPFGGSGGTGGNVCDRPLQALGSGQLTQERFDEADAGLAQTIALAGRGDVEDAQVVFLSRAHDFTHAVDGPLRDSNNDLARRLCRAVVQIEGEFAGAREAATIEAQAEAIRDLLRQAAAEMGFQG